MSELARVCNLSRTTVYKYLALLEGEKKQGAVIGSLFSLLNLGCLLDYIKIDFLIDI